MSGVPLTIAIDVSDYTVAPLIVVVAAHFVEQSN